MAHHTSRLSLRAQLALQAVVTYSAHTAGAGKSKVARKRAETQALVAVALRRLGGR